MWQVLQMFTWVQEEISLRYKNQTKAALNCSIWTQSLHNFIILSANEAKRGREWGTDCPKPHSWRTIPFRTAGTTIRIQTLTLLINGNTEKNLLYDLCGPCGFASFCHKETKMNLGRGEGKTQNQQMQTSLHTQALQPNKFLWIIMERSPESMELNYKYF